MPAVDLLLDRRLNNAAADIFVDRVVGEAEVVLVGEPGQPVGGRLDKEALGQPELIADGEE